MATKKAPAKKAPSKRITRSNITPEEYVNRPSQITRKAPTKRAVNRRQIHLDSGLPVGYFPNPVKTINTVYVLCLDGEPIRTYVKKSKAEAAAKTQAEVYPRKSTGLYSTYFES